MLFFVQVLVTLAFPRFFDGNKAEDIFLFFMFQDQSKYSTATQASLKRYAFNFMVLLFVDYLVLIVKIHFGFLVVRSQFARVPVGRYMRFSHIFYIPGAFKLILIDLAFMLGNRGPEKNGSVVVSIPIYSLTMIYMMCSVVFLPILGQLLLTIDKSHAVECTFERTRTYTKLQLDERIQAQERKLTLKRS